MTPNAKTTGNSSLDEMDELMSDWSWRQGQVDPGYVYTPEEVWHYEAFNFMHPGHTMPAAKPWSFPAYTGPAVPPKRIRG